MANPQRGEVAGTFDGGPRTLCLTLGALAELEASLGAGDLVALAERFERGALTAAEAIAVLGAGLRGAGGSETDAQVARMHVAGGATGAIVLVAALLRAAFGSGEPVAETGVAG